MQLEIKVIGARLYRPVNQQDFEEDTENENEVEQQLTDLQKRELELTQKIAEFKLQGKDQDYVERAKCGFSQLGFDLNKINEQKQVLRDAGWSEERIDQIENTFDLEHYSFEEQQKNNDWQYKQEPNSSYEYEPEQLEEAREILSDNGWTYDEIYNLMMTS